MGRDELPDVAEIERGWKETERNPADKVAQQLVENLGFFAEELYFKLKAKGSYGEVYREVNLTHNKEVIFAIRQAWHRNPGSASFQGYVLGKVP